jgi:nucleoside-diphosphate-sugar epimerase
MRVFLTGSTGFIGRHVAVRLTGMGFDITCLVRKSNVFSDSPNIKVVEADLQAIGDRQRAYDLVRGHDYVIHGAAIRGEQSLPWAEYYRVNVDATRSLLEASLRAGVRRFVFLSSVGVMGTRPRQLPASEEAPYAPDGKYHRSKMLAEQQVLDFSRNGLHTIAIRPSVTYGPYDNGFFLRAGRIVSRGFFPLVGGGRNLIHLTYIDGLVDAVVKALDAPVNPGGVYIIADSEPVSFKSLAELIAGALKCRVRYMNIPSPAMAILGARLYDALMMPIKHDGSPLSSSTKILSLPWYYDCSRAVTELGYRPFDTRAEAPRTAEWLQANGMIDA